MAIGPNRPVLVAADILETDSFMTNETRRWPSTPWVLSFLAAIVAVLVIVGLAATSTSASGVGVAETRVQPSGAPAPDPVARTPDL